MKTVILAAGSGTRFQNQGTSTPKPLIEVGGLPLLERAVRTAAKSGASEFIIVGGMYLDQLRHALEKKLQSFKITWIHNPDWELGNGTSLLAVESLLKNEERFLVLMCDHLFFSKTLSGLIEKSKQTSKSVMAIDRKRNHLTDISDATKVSLNNGHISQINKQLDPYDAIDIGAGVCTPQVFAELLIVRSAPGGKCSHSDGMRRLASAGSLEYHDIGQDVWEDADESESLKAAEKMLYQSLRKQTDGFLSKVLERNLSLTVTRFLAKTSLKPNHVTFFIVLLGLLSAFLFASTSYRHQVMGALVFWMSSFLDGCDGELARLKFMETRLGGWLDLWSDNIIHMMVFGGIGIGLYRMSGSNHWLFLAGAAVCGVFLSVAWVSLKTLKAKKDAGPFFTSVIDENEAKKSSQTTGFMIRFANALSRRDFIFYLIFITLLQWQGYFLWMTAIGSNIYFIILVLIHWRLNQSHA